MDQRRPGAGCPTGGSQGVGKQGEPALKLDPSSLGLGIDLVLAQKIYHDKKIIAGLVGSDPLSIVLIIIIDNQILINEKKVNQIIINN